jgi:hypothetical protein
MTAKQDLATLIFDYWTKPSPANDPIIKPAMRDVVAFGVIGNQVGEYSLKWPPGAGDKRSGEPSAYGIAQWHWDRRNAIFVQTGIDVASAGPLDQQRAMWWELRYKEVACLYAIHAAATIENEDEAIEAVVNALVDKFEYSSSRERDKAKRLEYARFWRDYFRTQGITGGLERHHLGRHQRTRHGPDVHGPRLFRAPRLLGYNPSDPAA